MFTDVALQGEDTDGRGCCHSIPPYVAHEPRRMARLPGFQESAWVSTWESALDPANLRMSVNLRGGSTLDKYFKTLPDGTQA